MNSLCYTLGMKANKVCTVTGCTDPIHGKQWCSKHYQRWKAHGDPEHTKTVTKDMSVEERLRFYGWDVVEGRLDTPCWEFKGYTDSNGYCQISIGGKETLVHRLAYQTWVGPLGKGEGYHGTVVRHKCDNPPCMNPQHLVAGTQTDNMRDMKTNGTSNRPVLDAEKARAIRASTEGTKVLAEMYAVTATTILGVRSGKTWKEPVSV